MTALSRNHAVTGTGNLFWIQDTSSALTNTWVFCLHISLVALNVNLHLLCSCLHRILPSGELEDIKVSDHLPSERDLNRPSLADESMYPHLKDKCTVFILMVSRHNREGADAVIVTTNYHRQSREIQGR